MNNPKIIKLRTDYGYEKTKKIRSITDYKKTIRYIN